MLSWWRRNRFSASSRRGDLKKSMTNIASECRSANIVRDHAMILPDDATAKPDGIFGKDRERSLNIELLKDQQMEGCHHRVSQCWELLSPNQKCEKHWTLPK